MTKRMNDTQQRKKQILEAARKIFVQKGFYNASIDDVAAEVGVVRGTVFHYYKSKKELMEAVLESTGEDLIPIITQITKEHSMPAKERILLLIEACSRQFINVKPQLIQYGMGQEGEEFRYLMDQMRIKAFYKVCELLEEILEDGCREGTFQIEDTRARACAVTFAVFGITGARLDADRIVKEMEHIINVLIFSKY